ncbi:hypothetical protein Rcae01_03475 [Novipirellula caenicola]|uniref:Transposase n=1 Tax=Novipirellula caenicola TaxID=1536901 RepID=A0ABP9VTT0_9BACT
MLIPTTLRDWHRKFAPTPKPCDDNASVEQLTAEVKRLRKELARVEMEREIQKNRRRDSRKSRSEIRLDQKQQRHLPNRCDVSCLKGQQEWLLQVVLGLAKSAQTANIQLCSASTSRMPRQLWKLQDIATIEGGSLHGIRLPQHRRSCNARIRHSKPGCTVIQADNNASRSIQTTSTKLARSDIHSRPTQPEMGN